MVPIEFFFLMIRRPPRSTLLPYPPLFRADAQGQLGRCDLQRSQPRPFFPYAFLRDDICGRTAAAATAEDRKSTRLNSSHLVISYAVFCLNKNHRAQNS